jgi:Glycosyl hydrolase family 92 N-terminal domain
MLLSFLIKLSFFVTVFTLASASQSQFISDPASLVNLFIGTTNGGHVFPGATLPHGMVKVGMDTDSPANVILSKLFFHHEMIVLITSRCSVCWVRCFSVLLCDRVFSIARRRYGWCEYFASFSPRPSRKAIADYLSREFHYRTSNYGHTRAALPSNGAPLVSIAGRCSGRS